MLFWLIPLLLLPPLLLGYGLLRYACLRRDLPEGWEDSRVEKSGDPRWQAAYRAGKAFLAGRESEELTVQSEDGFLLHALFLPHVAPRATVLLFHGWRSSWEMDFTCVLPFLYSLGLQCILVDQRAQGDSEGRWMTLGVRERQDVSAWVELAAGRLGRDHPLILQGLSMGATTVLLSAGRELPGNVRGIVADCGFTSPREIIAHVWRERTPFPAGPALWLLEGFARLLADFSLGECSTVEAMAHARYPVLFFHGTKDDLVPSYMTRRAYDACVSEKALLLAEGAGHGMSYILRREEAEDAYRAFLDKHLG